MEITIPLRVNYVDYVRLNLLSLVGDNLRETPSRDLAQPSG